MTAGIFFRRAADRTFPTREYVEHFPRRKTRKQAFSVFGNSLFVFLSAHLRPFY